MFFFFLTSPGQSQCTKRIDTPISHFQIAATASRPTIESKTNEDEKEVQTETLTIKARPMADGYVIGDGKEESSNLDMFSLEMFENIAFIMAKHADPSIPDTPEEWLDNFNTFSIYQVLPQLIELWGLNVKTDVESKKKFAQLSVK